MAKTLDLLQTVPTIEGMTILFSLLVIVILVSIGVVIGVHNANSSTVAPIARAAQEIGRKSVKSIKSPKKK